MNVFEIEERSQDDSEDVLHSRGREIHLELQKFGSELKKDESGILNFYMN